MFLSACLRVRHISVRSPRSLYGGADVDAKQGSEPPAP